MSFLKWNNKSMTPQETDLLKGIQKTLGITQDGYFGAHTLATLYRKDNPSHRFSMVIDGNYVIFSNTFKAKHTLNKSNLKNEPYSISGTFQYKNVTSSMLCIDGKWIRSSSTHDWLKQPETVLYLTDKNIVGCERALYLADIKQDLKQAIGGMGLHNWDIEKEGFIGAYADVHRKTGHTAIGHDGLGFIGIYFPSATSMQVKNFMQDNMRCKYSIMLDGGHIAACNTPDGTKNSGQLQNNIVTF